MLIGALLDLGADESSVTEYMEIVGGISVVVKDVKNHGIKATRVIVETEDEGHRKFVEVRDILNDLSINEKIKRDALNITEKIAIVEAKIHNTTIDKVVFHEVGALDAIADVLGACRAFFELGKDRKICSTTISLGGGRVNTLHGVLPVPAPATLELLSGTQLMTQGGPIDEELLTPTGAAILGHFVKKSFPFFPEMAVERIGYGAGSKDLPFPNVLRAVIGKGGSDLQTDEISVIETNVDDVTGEILGNLIEQLLDLGARDVAVIPATMKKGRSGHIIQVIAKPSDVQTLARKMIEETGTLGVRVLPIRHRLIALREMRPIELELDSCRYEVMVKVAYDLKGEMLNVSCEFEDAKKVAASTGRAVKDVMQLAEERAKERLSNGS